MYHITTHAHGLRTEQRPDGRHTRECFVDDDVVCSALPPIFRITQIDQPGGKPATINGGTLVLHEIGKHLFRVEFSDGASAHLHLMACDRACLARIPSLNHGRTVNPSADPQPPERSFAEQCHILRALSQHEPLFLGTAESMASIRLQSYGC